MVSEYLKTVVQYWSENSKLTEVLKAIFVLLLIITNIIIMFSALIIFISYGNHWFPFRYLIGAVLFGIVSLILLLSIDKNLLVK